MIGQISSLYGLICKFPIRGFPSSRTHKVKGSDAAVHMSEEIKDASATFPKAMITSYLLNATLGFVFLISFKFCITDITAAWNDTSGYLFFWVFGNIISIQDVNGLSSIVILLISARTVSYNLSTSRQPWAFYRDAGLPFGGGLRKSIQNWRFQLTPWPSLASLMSSFHSSISARMWRSMLSFL